MTTTIVIGMPILVDFEYEPADPSVNLAEYYEINKVFAFNVKIPISLSLEIKIVEELQAQREQLIKETREEGLMPRSRYKEA